MDFSCPAEAAMELDPGNAGDCLRSHGSRSVLSEGFAVPGEQEVSFAHGPKKGLRSVASATFLLCCLSLGVGVFMLPTVVRDVGWVVGLSLMVLFGVLTMALQIQLLDVAVDRNVTSWDELARLAPGGKVISSISLFLSLIIGNAAHIQAVSAMLFDLMAFFILGEYSADKFTTVHKIVLYCIFLGFAAPHCFGDDLGALSHIGKSVAAVVIAACLAVAVSSMIHIAEGTNAGMAPIPIGSPGFSVVLQKAPTVCFAFTGMLNFWEVFAALRKGTGEEAPKKMRSAVTASSVIVLAAYLVVAISAGLAFGNQTGHETGGGSKGPPGHGDGNVLYNFHNLPVTCLSFCVVVVIVLDYPVINFPLVEMFLRSQRLGLGRVPFARIYLSVAFMLIVILLDSVVPNTGDVFGLCGSLGLSTYCVTLPGLILLFGSRKGVHKVTGGLAAVFGLVMLIGSTFFIIKGIINGQ